MLTAFADRAIPVLLVLLLVALTASVTAIEVLAALLVLLTIVRLLDPARRARFSWPLAAPLLAFALLTLASAAASPEAPQALRASKQLASLPLVWVVANGFESGARARRALGVFFAAVALVSLYAIVQAWACTSAVPLPAWAGSLLKVRLETCRVTLPFRAKGFFSIYMTLAGTLTIATALLLALLGPAIRRARALLIPGALAFVALGLTLVRSAWLGCGASLGLLLVLSRRLVLILPVAVALLVALTVPSPFQARFLSMLDPGESTARERFYFWEAGAAMVREAPLLGWGPGGVRRHYPEFKRPDAVRPRTGHLHNNLVQLAAERGLLGLGAWLWIWVAFYFRATCVYRALPPARADDRALVAGSLAAVTGFLVMGLFEYNFGDSEVLHLVWVVAALPFVVARDALAPRQA